MNSTNTRTRTHARSNTQAHTHARSGSARVLIVPVEPKAGLRIPRVWVSGCALRQCQRRRLRRRRRILHRPRAYEREGRYLGQEGTWAGEEDTRAEQEGTHTGGTMYVGWSMGGRAHVDKGGDNSTRAHVDKGGDMSTPARNTTPTVRHNMTCMSDMITWAWHASPHHSTAQQDAYVYE